MTERKLSQHPIWQPHFVKRKQHSLCDFLCHMNSVVKAAIKQQKTNIIQLISLQTYDLCCLTQLKRQKS